MKTLFIILIIFFSHPAWSQSPLVMSLGESRPIPLGQARSVWIENRQIIQATAAGNQLILKGMKIGTSLLRINGHNQRIQVLHPAQMESYTGLQKVVRNIAGLNVDLAEGQLILKGHLYRLQDWQKIASKNLHFSMQASLTEGLQSEAQNYFSSLMKQERLPRLNIVFSGGVEVRLHPKSIYKEKYQHLFAPYGIQVVLDEEALESAPTIKVQITVAEIHHDLAIKYGLHWPEQYTATILKNTREMDLDDFVFEAHALENKGYGKVLASPNIICKSGQEAEFLAGGEFPIKIINIKIQDIVWKKYGIHLKVKPRADSTGRMSISIETEVSSLDKSTAVDGVPGILTNHVSSHFDLLKPRTIALSGLIKNEDSKSHQGLPFLSRLPVLGALFSSQDFQQNRSELVIFVRPTILDDENDPEFNPSAKNHLGDVTWK
jgi:pilus assembly protein CpaC